MSVKMAAIRQWEEEDIVTAVPTVDTVATAEAIAMVEAVTAAANSTHKKEEEVQQLSDF